MKKRELRNVIGLIAVISVFLISTASATEYANLLDQGVRVFKVNAVFLKVRSIEGDGAHLQEDQWLLVVGPLGPDKDKYRVQAIGVESAPVHKWEESPNDAVQLGSSGSEYFQLNVRIKTGHHTNPADDPHSIVMKVVSSDADGPKEVEFWGPEHVESGGDHGGTAHANR